MNPARNREDAGSHHRIRQATGARSTNSWTYPYAAEECDTTVRLSDVEIDPFYELIEFHCICIRLLMWARATQLLPL